MKLDILAFAAHPDDVELAASGTLLTHIAQGYKAGVIDLTQGELGTRGNAKLRLQEAAESAKILGLSARGNLGFRDGFFVKDEAHILRVIEMVRKYQPEIVLCNSETDRHTDHGRAADLVHEACFLSGLRKVETHHNGQVQKHWRPKAVYHYIQDYWTEPNIIVDITPHFETKITAIKAFESQFYKPTSTEPQSPISGKDFLDFITGRARQFGRLIGKEYGEGFTVKRPIGSTNLMLQL